MDMMNGGCSPQDKTSVGHRRPIVKSKRAVNDDGATRIYSVWGESAIAPQHQHINYTCSTFSPPGRQQMNNILPLHSAVQPRHGAAVPVPVTYQASPTANLPKNKGWGSPNLSKKASEVALKGSYTHGTANLMPTSCAVPTATERPPSDQPPATEWLPCDQPPAMAWPTTDQLPAAAWLTRDECQSDSDSDSSDGLTHPNKFPVEIEYHDNQHCVYKRQNTRSGPKVRQRKSTVYQPNGSSLTGMEVQQVKYYQKDLVRICRCGKYNQMDGALVHGRANDCDGYEIHYSQKCKWKAYDDYKTGKRVLIRLCKCYKPML